jgi:ribosomal protein L28
MIGNHMSHSRADSKRRCVFNLSAPNWKHLEELGWECIKVEVIIKPINEVK